MSARGHYTDEELFDRSVATLIESWAYFATGSPGAELVRTNGAAVAVFVHSPDREIFNNTVLSRGAAAIATTMREVERVYADRGIERYAVWVHESDEPTASALKERGYSYDSSTRTMAISLHDAAAIAAEKIELTTPDAAEFYRINGLPTDLFPHLDVSQGHIYVGRFEGRNATTLMGFDHEGDCGIYNVATLPFARRRGLGTALTAHALAEARARGCTTASLQSTEMAERVYASVGFRDLGRFDEYVPAS